MTDNKKNKLSEIEAQMTIINLRIQRHIKETKERLEYINEQLKKENLSEKDRIDLEGAKHSIEQDIQKLRFAGLFNEFRHKKE